MLAITYGTLITVSHGIVTGGTLLIDDGGRIAAIGQELDLPEGAESVDASGNLRNMG